ncbi:MAG: hypothetical protein AB7S75_01220 [Desulfococcaceae bacterium]
MAQGKLCNREKVNGTSAVASQRQKRGPVYKEMEEPDVGTELL